MCHVDSTDPAAFEAHLRTLDPRLARYGRAMSRLIDTVKEWTRQASDAGRPADKVRALQMAKLSLSELEACAVKECSIALIGLDGWRDRLDRLEQTYRAFGYYRIAGVA